MLLVFNYFPQKPLNLPYHFLTNKMASYRDVPIMGNIPSNHSSVRFGDGWLMALAAAALLMS